MDRSDSRLRKTMVDACGILEHEALVHAYGHVSARARNGKTIWITPRMGLALVRSPQQILSVDLGGTPALRGTKNRGKGKLQLPLEYFLHTEIYRARKDVNAICRTHGKYSLVLSVLRRPVRPVHELAVILGPEVPLFDSPQLISSSEVGRQMVEALGSARALLLRGNGGLTVGATIEEAVVNAIHMEISAEVQWRALCIGDPAWIQGDEFSGEFARLAKRDYEAVLRPWHYYSARRRGR